MIHSPGGILIWSTQEIHFCFCEMSQWPSHARDNSSPLAATRFYFVDPVRLPFDLFDYWRVFWWKHLVFRSTLISLNWSDYVWVFTWPNILPGKRKSLSLMRAVALELQVPWEAETARGLANWKYSLCGMDELWWGEKQGPLGWHFSD